MAGRMRAAPSKLRRPSSAARPMGEIMEAATGLYALFNDSLKRRRLRVVVASGKFKGCKGTVLMAGPGSSGLRPIFRLQIDGWPPGLHLIVTLPLLEFTDYDGGFCS
jgi:hypothetical protein